MQESSLLETQVYDLIQELAPDSSVSLVTGETRLVEDLAYHSIALVELGFAIERQFGLDPIRAEDVEDVRTAGDLFEFVAGRLRSNIR